MEDNSSQRRYCHECGQEIVDEYEKYGEYRDFMKKLRGVRKIAINISNAGFFLSRPAQILYLQRAGIAYRLVPQPDRDTQQKLGDRLLVNNVEWTEWQVARDDPALISVIEDLGKESWGNSSVLKIVEIPADIEWYISYEHGRERINEKHRHWS